MKTLSEEWTQAWPAALNCWSRFTQIREPMFCQDDKEAKAQGLTSSFAMIRLNDHAIVINLAHIKSLGLENYPLEVMAHEIGHHVFCPGDLGDHGRMLAVVRHNLPLREEDAGLVANLYSDLLINDRLKRVSGLRMEEVYRRLATTSDGLWRVYMRIYEILWAQKTGSLSGAELSDLEEGDAQLGSRIIRVYAHDWNRGAGLFAALCHPYLDDGKGEQTKKIMKRWLDTANTTGGEAFPAGLVERDDAELGPAIHPSQDPNLNPQANEVEVTDSTSQTASSGQAREPFEYGAILKAMGLKLDRHDVAVRYYKERATPHLIKFPRRQMPESQEPLAEGLEPWDIGSPIESADWFESLIRSPQIIPGVTTVQRVYGTSQGDQPSYEAVDLDLYIDCSGSMPNPQSQTSYLALAGAIIALSALKVGSRVQATLWSGPRQFQTTNGFVDDEQAILRIVTGYLGGSTAFPIHLLRDTYETRSDDARPVHIMVISDSGVDTMFAKDEKGASGWDIAAEALNKARGGGTLVLQLWKGWQQVPDLVRAHELGFNIHQISDWLELESFARAFAREQYEVVP